MDQTLGIEISTGCGYQVGEYALSVPSVGLTDSRLHGKKHVGHIMLAVGVTMGVAAGAAAKFESTIKLVSGIRR